MYGKADGNAALARRLYQERYPQRQCPDRKTFVHLYYRLCEYGKFISPGLGRGRPRSTTPELQEEILEAVNMTPSISTRRALSPADYPARVRFCQWFLQQCGVNPNFPALVLFTDEAQFTRDGITNFHNQHVWAYENPRATVPSHHQVRFSLNMWAGIIGDRLVGPHVLVNRLTGQAYTNFLENTIPHVLEDTPLINRQHIHFLHDGAPAHFSRTARRYLDRRFPDRWIVATGVAQSFKTLACRSKVALERGFDPPWADYLVGFFPRFFPNHKILFRKQQVQFDCIRGLLVSMLASRSGGSGVPQKILLFLLKVSFAIARRLQLMLLLIGAYIANTVDSPKFDRRELKVLANKGSGCGSAVVSELYAPKPVVELESERELAYVCGNTGARNESSGALRSVYSV
ncbi:hypothetical protein ANN_25110 [Periplaneta americana]|uniref:DUF4817 domain-containing protein n=1 Tax=Periplaneta americana TaxID=6978 RepID=A0ABQ8S0G3_PERAM|nr:hypothetical protein ANN_25110 [Periplaneta americana]